MRNVCALGSTPLMPDVINIILFHNSVNMDAVIKSSRRALTEAWTAITTRMENKADEWEEGERSFDQTPPFELTHTFFLLLYLNPTLTCLFKDLLWFHSFYPLPEIWVYWFCRVDQDESCIRATKRRTAQSLQEMWLSRFPLFTKLPITQKERIDSIRPIWKLFITKATGKLAALFFPLFFLVEQRHSEPRLRIGPSQAVSSFMSWTTGWSRSGGIYRTKNASHFCIICSICRRNRSE